MPTRYVRSVDVDLPIRGLETNQRHTIILQRIWVPILFVPGIMGSRLCLSAGPERKVWDPDDAVFMARQFFRADAAAKKALVIGEEFNQNRLRPLNTDPKHNRTYLSAHPGAAERGWGGVFWEVYGPILEHLSRTDTWSEWMQFHFRMPVHAFGYNWTASNQVSGDQLAREIDALIRRYRDAGRDCEQVILVTHSMGGLVARAALLQPGVAEKVLGVVHGVQPATGSPAAYWRMRAGFPREGLLRDFKEWAAANVLGRSGPEVTALLGNMPGGLELLPTAAYRRRLVANVHEREWLVYPQGGEPPARHPRRDPFAEIYAEARGRWRLVVDPAWLAPEAGGDRSRAQSAWREYLLRIDDARAFHDQLGLRQHPRSYHFYGTGADRYPTPATVRFRARRVRYDAVIPARGNPNLAGGLPPRPRPAAAVCADLNARERNRGGYVEYQPIPREGRTDYPLQPSDEVLCVEMLDPRGSGDATVPEESGSALCHAQGTLGHAAFPDIAHEKAFTYQAVQRYVVECIEALCVARVREAREAREAAAVGS
jgi:pimeloyl-ACP methyl ester carboxylesterase